MMKTNGRLITAGDNFSHASLERQTHCGSLLQTTKKVF